MAQPLITFLEAVCIFGLLNYKHKKKTSALVMSFINKIAVLYFK